MIGMGDELDIRGKLALTEDEAAAAIGVCKNTLHKMRTEEGLPYFKSGRAIRIPVSALEAWLCERAESQVDEDRTRQTRIRRDILATRSRKASKPTR